MDFTVEATVHLESFPDKGEVRSILTSHGLELNPLDGDSVRVKGPFLDLKAANASLEQCLRRQSKTHETSPPSFNTDDTRGGSGFRNKPSYDNSSSPLPLVAHSSRNRPLSSEHSDFFPPKLEQSASFRPGKESFLVDSDVYLYAKQLRKKDIDTILESHNVKMQASEETQDSYEVTLMGKSAKLAAGKIQSLFGDLSRSLRTQEVHKKDMDDKGRALLDSIQKHGNVSNSVVVSVKNDTVHLIGSSRESYELKQRLLGNRADHSGRTGRTLERSQERRSQSLPPRNRKDSDRDRASNTISAGAEGYPSSTYQTRAHAEPEQTTVSCFNMFQFMRRSQSLRRVSGLPNSYQREAENRPVPAEAPKARKPLFPFMKDDVNPFKIRGKK